MSRSVKNAVLVGLLALLLNLGLSLVAPLSAQAAPPLPAWRQLDTQSCAIFLISSYRPNQAFCTSHDKFTDQRILGLINLKDGTIQTKPVLINANILYEDGATGFLLALYPDGKLYRIGTDLTYESKVEVLRGPTDNLSQTIIRSAGYGTGVFFVRFGNSSYWFSSYDNGRTWQRSFEKDDPNDKASIYDIQFSANDPNVAYGLSRTVMEYTPGGGYDYFIYLYKSTDMGRSFKRVYRTPYFASDNANLIFSYDLSLPPAQARTSSVVYLTRYTYYVNAGSSSYYRSNDGGNSFKEIGSPSGGRGGSGGELYLAPDGTTLQSGSQSCYTDNSCGVSRQATRSLDNGETFQTLGNPPDYFLSRFWFPQQATHTYYAIARQPGRSQFDPVRPLPARLVRSTNGGAGWEFLPDKDGPDLSNPYDIQILLTDYAPTSLILVTNNRNKAYVLDDEGADRTQTQAVTPNPGQDFYEATRHNLGLFKGYWSKNGGLAQFGYPQTEVFREINPSDGHIYPVQYFERNRLEYHLELKGTPYEVLLGLLGNQLTVQRRANGDGAFNRFDNQNYPGGSYYPETGHNLRNSFKLYWEANGGLSIYGFPISEEFQEINPDDGKTYVVQYFERARFEYHPENKGSQYEVLLGLLGNTLLREKGWF